jgi:hypothetical protein
MASLHGVYVYICSMFKRILSIFRTSASLKTFCYRVFRLRDDYRYHPAGQGPAI